ncbi:MAG: ATP-binding cassette domain-containing protein [Anaerolineae bacterium]|nr:ATP-binding cassette domain-containing protein [Anaerolineae bacterium]MDW8171587.1 ATP-binding cassette domain-containing protein [Anaerolineae bacterium]
MEIVLKNISKRFGAVRANQDISVAFYSGRIVGVLGENGAGKSTLMKILSGFQAADSGEIWLDGQRVRYRGAQEAVRAGLGMLQQDPLDVPAFTVLENFVFGNPNLANPRQKLAELAARFGFHLDADALCGQLSIAQRQQLEIVRLLALGVRALILDEPTTGISAEQKELLFSTLRRLAREEGMTVLLVSHKLEDVIALCDEVIVLRGGRLVGRTSMPTTPQALVAMMFEELSPIDARPSLPLGQTALRVESLHLHVDRLHLHNLNFSLRGGETVGLAGLDGSGQEAFLRVCAGLLRPQRGRVCVGEQDFTHRSYRDFRRAGVYFTAAGRLEEGLIAGLTLTEHVALTDEGDDGAAWINWIDAEKRAAARIARYQVRGQPYSPIETLSGGNQQRVLISLLPEHPRALLLEQPTRGLDVDSTRWIWQQLEARRQQGAGIVFSSAELDELVTYSDRILVFYEGRCVEVADVRQTSADALGHLIGGNF